MTVKTYSAVTLSAAVLLLSSGLMAKPTAPAPVTPAPVTPAPAAVKPAAPTSPAAPAATMPAAPAKPETAAEAKFVYVLLQTSMGDITIELNNEKAPISTANFLKYAAADHYDGTIFHRIIDGFMVQGGGFTPAMIQKPVEPAIKNEWKNGLKNDRGTVSMARVGGNADSATSQFFINVVDNGRLDTPQPDGAAYAVFGKVIKGMDVVDKMRVAKTGMRNNMRDVPLETISITDVRKLSDEEAKTAKAAAATPFPVATPGPAPAPAIAPAPAPVPAPAPKK